MLHFRRSSWPAPRLIAMATITILPFAPAQGMLPAQGPEPFPPELVKFIPAQRAPVFAPAPGKWDAKIRERGWIRHEKDIWKMWYTGYDGTKDGLRMLGYATSKDGIHWDRHPKNPIYKDHWVEDMMVVKEADKYYMFAEGLNDRAHLLVSGDGIAWVRVGILDIRMKDGAPIALGPFGTPTAFKENDVWYLLYERMDRGIWLAASKDMKTWTNVQDAPVITPGPDEYDRDLIALNQVIKYKGFYYAYYHGCAASGPKARLWSTNVARSKDLFKWEKYPGNPLLPIDENKSSGIVIRVGESFRLYTMHPEVFLHVSPK
jgi:hypothetical protein